MFSHTRLSISTVILEGVFIQTGYFCRSYGRKQVLFGTSFSFQDFSAWPIYDVLLFRYMIWHERPTSGIRRSKVEVTEAWSYARKVGGDIILDPLSWVDRSMQWATKMLPLKSFNYLTVLIATLFVDMRLVDALVSYFDALKNIVTGIWSYQPNEHFEVLVMLLLDQINRVAVLYITACIIALFDYLC